jgi:hypothetical protein
MSKDAGSEIAREYKSPLAAELADWNSIRRDLRFVIRAVELAIELGTEPLSSPASDDGIRRLSLWSAALVAYARCFRTGVRRVRLDEGMFLGLGDQTGRAIRAHRYFLDQRDRFVAQSASRSEHRGIGLTLSDGKISAIGPYLSREVQQGKRNMRTLRALARTLLAEVISRVNVRQRDLLKEAKKLTPDELAALPEIKWSRAKGDGDATRRSRNEG